jgi:peptidoglycan/xylan/chitin deacetylase (PgdA/CDA1 family)
MFEALKLDTRQTVRRLAIAGGLDVAAALRGLGLGGKLAGRGVIFTLHHVRPHYCRPAEPNAHLEVTPEFLDSTLTAILEAGYEPIALSSLPDYVKYGDPSKPVAVFTLDDGYRNNLRHAAPVFERHNVPFTVFVSRGLSERTHSIWWETLEWLVNVADEFEYDFGQGPQVFRTRTRGDKMAAYERIGSTIIGPHERENVAYLDEVAKTNGIDPMAIVDELVMDRVSLKALLASPLAQLGAHTISHRAMSFLSRNEAVEEMTASAVYVSELTGRRARTFSYPYGFAASVSDRDKKLALECGFDLAVTTAPGTLSDRVLADFGGLPRVSLNGLYQKTRYVTALASGIPFTLTR